eukprot:TRINITY_DN780_c1_g3_i1.p1 TRINITY_DN780_c1_g3~~TRINITY_DN780_c1_g3_i1.p1  ORF type:complete len:759 (-),score=200.74 TRINITY_DN780_c1_g3_i1:174-2231(-)
MMIATAWALFATDFQLIALPKTVDDAFAIVTFIFFLAFAIDLVLSSLAKKGYFLSMFFFLDLIATISLLPDIPFIWDPFMESLGQGGGDNSNTTSTLGIARAGRAARAGTRAGRLVRIFKMFALLKSRKDGHEQPKDELEKPSVVGQRLSELTTRKVIVGIMTMVFVLPLLDPDPVDVSKEHGLNYLEGLVEVNSPPSVFNAALNHYDSSKLLVLNMINTPYPFPDQARRNDRLAELRKTEILYVTTNSRRFTFARFDNKQISIEGAAFNIVLTVFIIGLLAVGAALFSRDANKLMIAPIERMVSVVKKLGENPLAELDDPDQDKGAKEEEGKDKKGKKKKKEDNFETALIEGALRKIGSLLQVGFGQAGATIIGRNLQSAGSVDPMTAGKRVQGVFGFCDIRSFTDATECLQETVMPFVNTIADMVHFSVFERGGAPNKNVGDAFLVVFKTSDDDFEPGDPRGAEVEKKRANQFTDGCLESMIEIVDKMDGSDELRELTNVESLHARIPGYTCKMGFGIHYGWAIEGAIGSTLKIDASYLSPHVHMSETLESTTKAYGCMLLASGEAYDLMSPQSQRILRLVDVVMHAGHDHPMRLYTVDAIGVRKYPAEWDQPGAEFQLTDYYAAQQPGIEAYIKGDWATAKQVLEDALELYPADMTTKVILDFMGKADYVAPDDWPGYRDAP